MVKTTLSYEKCRILGARAIYYTPDMEFLFRPPMPFALSSFYLAHRSKSFAVNDLSFELCALLDAALLDAAALNAAYVQAIAYRLDVL